MSYLIAIDDGHGIETAGKRTPAFPDGTVIHENQFNSAVAKLFAEEMKRCGCETIFTAPTDADTPLRERVRTSNNAKADLFISFHFNAFTGTWDQSKGGVSTHYYGKSERSKKLAQYVQDELIKGTEQVNRGIVPGNLYVNKYTTMPSVLIEAGFMDVSKEAKLMLDKSFQKEVAREAAIGVCKYLGIPYGEEVQVKPQPVVNNGISFNPHVLAFQKACNAMDITGDDGNKLKEDGKLGTHTKAAIKKLKAVVRRGDKNPLVGVVQAILRIKIDNSYGKAPYRQTYDAIGKFQEANGLDVDYTVGPITWLELLS